MKLTIVTEDIPLSEIAISELFDEIAFFKKNNSEEFYDIKFDVLNYCIKNSLINYTTFDFTIEICYEKLGSYKYIFDMWLSELPKTYIAINKKQNFNWQLIEQGYEIHFNFKYKDGDYMITLGEFETPESQIKGSKQEVINIEVLKTEINSARLVYQNYIKENLGDVLPDYLDWLDLSFED